MTDLYGLWIPGNAPIPMRLNTRVRWVADEHYEIGAYTLSTDTDTAVRDAELAEVEALERGDLVAVGCIMETRCPHCEEWRVVDSLWGIVIEPGEDAAKEFYIESGLGDCFDEKETE